MHDERINTSVIEVPSQESRLFAFVFAEQGVDGGVDFRPELVGVVAQLANVVGGVACSGPCSEARSPDVDSVCAMIYGSNAAFQVTGGRKELKPLPSPLQRRGRKVAAVRLLANIIFHFDF